MGGHIPGAWDAIGPRVTDIILSDIIICGFFHLYHLEGNFARKVKGTIL